MTSQTGQQIIEIHILSNISKSKGNQTMGIVQVIEFNMKNAFLEKSYTKCGREATLKPLYKKSKLSITLDQQSEMLPSLFLFYVQFEIYQHLTKLR